MQMSPRVRHWLLSNYWWILGLLAVIATFVLLHLKEPISSLAAVGGGLLSFIYFVQKQKLEELKLFRELFKECNARYDAMNEALATLREPNEAALTTEECALLVDYFNLCGEEYLYYKQGYIPPSVWDAWYMGMQIVITSPRINELWRSEFQTGSYYGLPLVPFNLPRRADA